MPAPSRFTGVSLLRAEEKAKAPKPAANSALQSYLKKYTDGGSDAPQAGKKRKKKASVQQPSAVRIIDQDVTGFVAIARQQYEDELEDEEIDADEDRPTVANADEGALLAMQVEKARTFFGQAQDGSGWVQAGDTGNAMPRRGGQRHDLDSDASPPRRQERRDALPPRTQRHDSPLDASPPRRRQQRHDSPGDASPPRRTQRHDSPADASPPRRAQRHDSPPADASPPRRPQRHDSPPDASPPRRAQRHDSPADASPPRRVQRHDSPPDASPPRRSQRHDSPPDVSPPRQRQRRDSPPDASPPRRGQQQQDVSPPRRGAVAPVRTTGAASTASGRMADGTAVGLVSAQQLATEVEKQKRDAEQRRLAAGGRDAATVYRSKATGKAVTADEYAESLRVAKGGKKVKTAEEEAAEQHLEWRGGLAQKHAAEQRAAEMRAEAAKPFARGADDSERDAMFRERLRFGDPMAHLVKSKAPASVSALTDKYDADALKKSGFLIPQETPAYSWLNRRVAAPANRYNIRPGRHWDGVDRSNGFEKELFKQQNARRADEQEARMWSQADM